MKIFSTIEELQPLFEGGIAVFFSPYLYGCGFCYTLQNRLQAYEIGISTDFNRYSNLFPLMRRGPATNFLREQKITLIHELIHIYLIVVQKEVALKYDAPGYGEWESEIEAHAARIVDVQGELVDAIVAILASHPKCSIRFTVFPRVDPRWWEDRTPFAEHYTAVLAGGWAKRFATAEQLSLWDE